MRGAGGLPEHAGDAVGLVVPDGQHPSEHLGRAEGAVGERGGDDDCVGVGQRRRLFTAQPRVREDLEHRLVGEEEALLESAALLVADENLPPGYEARGGLHLSEAAAENQRGSGVRGRDACRLLAERQLRRDTVDPLRVGVVPIEMELGDDEERDDQAHRISRDESRDAQRRVSPLA